MKKNLSFNSVFTRALLSNYFYKVLVVFSVLSFSFISPYSEAQSRDYFDGVIGDVWLDTDGKHIQAHGGQVQKIGDKWWWIGENRDGDRSICLYSSDDLYNWKNEGKVLRVASKRSDLDEDPYFTALYGHLTAEEKDLVYEGIRSNAVLERPKLIYNEKTGKYIIWYHADSSNYGAAAAGIAVSDEITGPYTYLWRSRLHQLPDNEYSQPNQWYEETKNRGMARDMNLFVDDDKTAYIIYSSEENRTMFISRLNEEYTNLDVSQTPVGLAKNGVDFIRLFPGAQREAPAMFKYKGKYYMITSGATGWDPNKCQYWMADKIFGEWKNMGDPCVSEPGIPHPANLTFRTQSTNVIPVDPENGKFIYMGDRWVKNNLKDSRYVWLPIFFTEKGIELRSMERWTLGFFDLKYDESQFDDSYFSVEELPATLQASVFNQSTGLWEDKELPISWNDLNIRLLPLASPTKVSGIVDVNGQKQEVYARLTNVPQGLIYFIDCGASSSSFVHNAIVTKNLAPDLINKEKYDQAFGESVEWGYSTLVGKDMDSKNPESEDAFSSGWWAYSYKSIEYTLKLSNGKYYLTAGFQEWWNASRSMQMSLTYTNAAGEETKMVLGNFINISESTHGFSFSLDDLSTDDPYVKIKIEKTQGSDPVISWLAVTALDKSDLTPLELAILSANNIDNSKNRYTEDSFTVFETALAEAVAVLNNSDATDEEAENARTTLIQAQDQLKHDITNDSVLSIDEIPDQIYTGDSIKPELNIVDAANPFLKDITLQEGVHYTLTYTENVRITSSIRKAKVTIEGLGMYVGKKQVTFEIVKGDEPDALENILSDNLFSIYPNPVTSGQSVYVEMESDDIAAEKDVCIFSVSGQLIARQALTGKVTELNVPATTGVYLVKMDDFVTKLVIK